MSHEPHASSSPSAAASPLAAPGPSYLREQELHVADQRFVAGMARPADGPDDWWLTVLWVADGDRTVWFDELAPRAGPPPEPPLARLGPRLAGGLGGLIREEDGRLAIRLAPVAPPADGTRPWRCPLAIRAAFKWEPVRAATMQPNELASAVLTAFRRAVEDLGRR